MNAECFSTSFSDVQSKLWIVSWMFSRCVYSEERSTHLGEVVLEDEHVLCAHIAVNEFFAVHEFQGRHNLSQDVFQVLLIQAACRLNPVPKISERCHFLREEVMVHRFKADIICVQYRRMRRQEIWIVKLRQKILQWGRCSRDRFQCDLNIRREEEKQWYKLKLFMAELRINLIYLQSMKNKEIYIFIYV